MLQKILATGGSVLMSAFGVWHFFVPAAWRWYDYILPDAAELVLAVRAINFFFSLVLFLLGIVTLLFVYAHPDAVSLRIMLSLSCVLWAARCVLQLVYPQGAMNPALQYGMLAAFIAIFLCFVGSLLLVLRAKT